VYGTALEGISAAQVRVAERSKAKGIRASVAAETERPSAA